MKNNFDFYFGLALIIVLSFGSMSNDWPPNPTCTNPPGSLIAGQCVTAGQCLHIQYPEGGCYKIQEGVGNCYYWFTCKEE